MFFKAENKVKSSTLMQNIKRFQDNFRRRFLVIALLAATPTTVCSGQDSTEYRFTASGSSLVLQSQPISLGFAEAVERTMNANPARDISQAQIDQAQAARDQAQGNLLPSLELSIGISASNNPLNVFGMKLNQRQARFNDFGVAEYLDVSGFLNPNISNPADIDRANNLKPDALNEPGWHANIQTAIRLQIPVFNGGKIREMRAQAEALLRAARAGDQAAEQELLMHTVMAYGGVKTAQAFVSVASQAVEAARSYRDLSKRLHEQGVVTEADVLKAEVNLGERELLQSQAEHQYANALDGLKILIGLDPASELEVTESIEVALMEEDLAHARKVAMHTNPKIIAIGQQIEAARSEVGVARAAYRPHFNIMAQQEFNSETPGLRNDSYLIAGQLNWQILDFGARAGGVDRARAKVHQHLAERQQVLNQLINQIGEIYRRAQLTEQRVSVRALAIEQTKEAARIEQVRYEQGLNTMTELLEAQANLDHARAEYIRAQFEQLEHRAALWLATGRLSPDRIKAVADVD